MANDINDILGINLPKEEPASKSKIISDLLQNLVFSLGQGYSAQGTGRGSQARSAGIGAALQGPMVLQQIRDKQQADAQERQINLVKARELFRQNRNAEAMDLLKIRTQLPEETTMTPPPAPTEPVIEGTPETGLTVKSLGTPTYAKTRPEMFTLPNGQQIPLYPPSAGATRQAQDAADSRKLALEEATKQIEARYRAPQNIDPNSQIAKDRELAYQTLLSKIPQRPSVTTPMAGRDVPLPSDVEAQRKRIADESSGGILELTPEGLDAAATAFAKTGSLPPMGMSKQSAGIRTRIINRAAMLYPNLDIAANKADFSANQQSLSALTKNRDAVVAFENTASKNLDVFLKSAEKVADSGSPWVNQPLRAVDQRGLGSAGLAAFNAARQTAINEIAKVISNPNLTGQLSDSARKEVEAFIPADATLKQVVAVAKVLKTDMANRHGSLDEQIGAIRDRIKGGNQTPPAKTSPLDDEIMKAIRGAKKPGG